MSRHEISTTRAFRHKHSLLEYIPLVSPDSREEKESRLSPAPACLAAEVLSEKTPLSPYFCSLSRLASLLEGRMRRRWGASLSLSLKSHPGCKKEDVKQSRRREKKEPSSWLPSLPPPTHHSFRRSASLAACRRRARQSGALWKSSESVFAENSH